MYDFIINSAHTLVKNGFTVSSGIAILFLILKTRKMKEKLKQHFPFLFTDESVNPTYVQNQLTIMENQRRLMERMGLECAPTLNPDLPVTQTKRKKSFSLPWADLFHAHVAKPYTTWRRKLQMSNINKGILLPLLSAIALFVKQVWGFEISDEQINTYADIALYLIMFIGLFMKPKKENLPALDDME